MPIPTRTLGRTVLRRRTPGREFAIVRKSMQLPGGTLTAQGEVGVGTTFTGRIVVV